LLVLLLRQTGVLRRVIEAADLLAQTSAGQRGLVQRVVERNVMRHVGEVAVRIEPTQRRGSFGDGRVLGFGGRCGGDLGQLRLDLLRRASRLGGGETGQDQCRGETETSEHTWAPCESGAFGWSPRCTRSDRRAQEATT